MIRITKIALIALLISAASCTTTQIDQFTQAGALAAGKTPEEAAQLGQAASGVTSAFAPMPPEKENAIGGSIAITSFATMGRRHPDEALQRYVNLVGRTVAAKCDAPSYGWKFAVVDSPSVNAWAAPSGYIFITVGSLNLMEDEAELAGVLGHEVTHVAARHMIPELKRAELATSAVQGAAVFSKDDLSAINQIANAGTDLIFKNGYDRKYEYASDLDGIRNAAAAGYDATGLLRFLKAMEAKSGGSGGGWGASTHPPLNERIARLEADMVNYEGLDGAVQRERFQKVVKRALGS